MKKPLVVAGVTLLAGAALGAVFAYFSPSFNVVAGETGSDLRLMMNDTPHKAHVRAAGGAACGALSGLGLVLYANRIQRRKSGS